MTTTTIRIQIETRELLDKIGNKGDTYDDIVMRLCLKALKETKQ
jgi:hypothetical protein